MSLKIGDKVRLTKECAKWHLDHPEIFFNSFGDTSEGYDVVMQQCLFVSLGGEVIGTVTKYGAEFNIFGIEFNSKFGKDFSYFSYPRDFTVIK